MEMGSTPLLIGVLGGFMLLAILTLTSYVKLSVVLMIIRQAMGLQQVPSNMALMAVATFLAVFISMPVFSASFAAFSEATLNLNTPEELLSFLKKGLGPFQEFIVRNTEQNHTDFLVSISNEVWAGSGMTGSKDDFIIQVPAFMVTELTEAFQIGFLLYLPFVAIDLAITTILMALGMQQVQPNIIAVPFKLLLFVSIDGWARLVEGLLLSYGGGGG